jgi:hypothetical protein
MSEQQSRRVRYGTPNREYGMRLATTPPEEDGPIYMVNLMKYRAVASYADGNPVARSGREADDAYAPTDILRDIGAEVVFFGDVDQQLLGAEPAWDRVGVVKYATRRSFIEMQSRPDFREKHVHKAAGMEQTIVMGCLPMASPAFPADAPELPGVPHPATSDDGPVVVLHVIRFVESQDREKMRTYEQAAGVAAIPHGVRISGWFTVEGTILGDGRTWDEVRFNAFPSKAAFMAVAADPDRLQAEKDHRQAAIHTRSSSGLPSTGSPIRLPMHRPPPMGRA